MTTEEIEAAIVEFLNDTTKCEYLWFEYRVYDAGRSVVDGSINLSELAGHIHSKMVGGKA